MTGFYRNRGFIAVCSCMAFILISAGEHSLLAQLSSDETSLEKKDGSGKKETSDTEKAGKTEKQKSKPDPRELTVDREKAALNFVKEHHAVLFDLVMRLKKASPGEYQSAVRDLAQASEKLERIKKRDSKRYAIELQAWQAKSRGELLAAQLQMDDSPALRKQLRDVLIEETDLRIELLKLEQKRLSERLEKINNNIEAMTESRENNADRRLEQYTRSFSSKKNGVEVAVPKSEKKKKSNNNKSTLSNP